jgi:predicted O-methyltransferase YrrM
MVESHCMYNSLVTEQTSRAINVLLPNFLKIVQPVNIVEIGTAVGGFTHFLSDTCPNSQIITIELKDYYHYEFKKNVTSLIVDSNDEKLIKQIMIPFIQSTGVTIVFCDGGSKIMDFINYARQ